MEIVDEVFIGVGGFFPDVLFGRRLSWVGVVVVFPCTILFV